MTTEKPLVILDPHFRTMHETFWPEDLERMRAVANVVWAQDEPMPEDRFAQAIADAEIVITAGWRYTPDVIKEAKNLRAVIDIAGSFPVALDYDYCYQNRIQILSAAPAFARQVAEMSLAMALDASREVSLGDRAFREGREIYLHAGNTSTFMLYDKPVGFIGYGSIARELQRLLAPFNVKLSAYDPWLADGYIRHLGATPVSVETLLDKSQVIFILAAPSAENRAFLDRPLLERVQPGAVVVLMSRAHVVDFDALTELALAGRFKVATDVFPEEPLSRSHPIRGAENALLSAHRAGSLLEGLREIGELVADDVEAILQGMPPQRLQPMRPELSRRYTKLVVPAADDR